MGRIKKADEMRKKQWKETCKNFRDIIYEITLIRYTGK